MANPKLKLGNDIWATKQKSLLAYNDEGGNFKSLPFQVDRISGGTYIGRNGLIQTAASNEPRVDFLNNTKGGLLLEPQRTNVFTNSENLSNIDYKTNSTITVDNIIAPNGSLTADKTTQTTSGYLRETVSVSNGTTYTFSVFLKKGDLRYAVLRSLFSQNGGTPANSNNVFDLDNGNVIYTGTNVISASIEAYSNDWFRCSFISLASSSGSAPFIDIYFSSSSSGTQSSGTSGFGYGWGMQLEAGTYASSYIPTQGSAVTRVQDYVSKGGNEYIFNDSEGVLFAEIQALANDQTYRFISISDNSTSSNRVVISYNTTSNQIRCDLIVGGSTQSTFPTNLYDITQKNKVAIQYKLNEVKAFVNGLQIGTTDTFANVFPSGTLNQINFDNGNLGSTFYFEGFLNDLQYFDEALSDAELQTLTQV